MEKISGLVLDAGDDVTGSIMRSLYASVDDIPDLVKTAGAISADQRAALPDNVFALVLHQGDTTLRKYACVDAGNTALNVAYLLSTYDRLPMEAVKVAASNLCTACHWYDIEPPEELKKLSTGAIPVIGKQQTWKDLAGNTYGNNSQSWDLEKKANVTGSNDMPLQASLNRVNPARSKLSVVKTAEDQFEDNLLEAGEGLPTTDNPAAEPQVKKVLTPHVDVSSHEPPTLVTEKKAHLYAMPSIGKYPLDGFDHVEKAASYFDANYKFMPPADRREYAHNLCKRAHALRKPLSDITEEYGGNDGYAKEAQLVFGIETRKGLLRDMFGEDKIAATNTTELYDQLFASRVGLTPEVYARTLHEIDKVAGLDEHYDGDLDDPWRSTFGKVASDVDPKDAIVVGNEYMNVDDLLLFAQSKSRVIEARFGADFLEEFQGDPVAIFNSLPADQKLVIMRMVSTIKSIPGASAS